MTVPSFYTQGLLNVMLFDQNEEISRWCCRIGQSRPLTVKGPVLVEPAVKLDRSKYKFCWVILFAVEV